MAILVTGGTGYIGSHTVVDLLNHDYEVVIVDNYSNSKPEVLNRIFKITGKRPNFYLADIQDYEGMKKVFENENISDVIHFAASFVYLHYSVGLHGILSHQESSNYKND